MAGIGGAIEAGKAFVKLFADDKELKSGLESAAAKIKGFGAGIAKAGAVIGGLGSAVLAPLLGFSKLFADVGSELFDMSARTGIAVESLSTLGFAAEQSGSSLGAVEVAMKKLGQTITRAGDDGKKANETLEDLGVTLGDLKGLKPDEQFRKVAAAIGKIADANKRGTAAIAVFGKQGKALLPMINDMAALEQQARDLGIVMGTDEAKAADELGDSLGAMHKQLKAITLQIGASLAPMLTEFVDMTAPILKQVIDWVKNNRDLIVTIAKVAGVVAGLGAGLVVLGGLIAFLVTPLGLVVAAVTAAVVGFGLLTDETGTLEGVMKAAWKGIQDAAMFGLDVIINVVAGAIAAWNHLGEIVRALPTVFEVAALDMALGVKKGFQFIVEGIASVIAWVQDNFVPIMTTVFANVVQIVINAAKTVTSIWAKVWKVMANPLAVFQVDVAKEMAKLTAGLIPVGVKIGDAIFGDGLGAAADDARKRLAEMLKPFGLEQQKIAGDLKAGLFGLFGGGKGIRGVAPGLDVPDAESARGKVEAVGTFSAAAAAAGGLGAKSVDEKMLKKLEEIAKEATKQRIALELINLGVV